MNRSESIISLKDVSFSFLQSGFHMENLKIDIKKGEFIGLVGESGSGKSTIGRLLAAIYNRKDAGSLASLDGSLRVISLIIHIINYVRFVQGYNTFSKITGPLYTLR